MRKIFTERCCMCPRGGANRICPPGYLEKESSTCQFVNAYTDENGYRYQVEQIGTDLYQVCYRSKESDDSCELTTGFQSHDNFDDAQEELNKMAARRKWSVVNEYETADNGGGAGSGKCQAEKENQ